MFLPDKSVALAEAKGGGQMAVKIKPIKSTQIKDARIWATIVEEVSRKPTPEASARAQESIRVLEELRR